MKEKELINIYNEYFAQNLVSCPLEEAEKVVEEYRKTGKDIMGYTIEKTENGYRVWKNEETNKTLDQIKAEIEVENAKNIRTIKKCIVFFTVCAVISLIVGFIMGLVILSK